MNKIKEITSFKQIKKIIAPIPPRKFCINDYYQGSDPTKPTKCCFLGHIQFHIAGTAAINYDGFGARELTRRMIEEVHGINEDGAEVNNSPTVNGYKQKTIKDRLMHMIEDGIKWEQGKLKV